MHIMKIGRGIKFEWYICAYFKNPSRYSDKIFQNLKRGAVAWDQLFSVHFFVRNMGKIVPPPNKNGVFLNRQKSFLPC